uniref:Uncharacterized protein n=1 Tax=Noctiluca scintillans TaxID=2966 RepID=A0A7S1FID3_NOCSC|mmetsp:Transcript_6841/g.18940  ORF Transcript_6841/g.18940 Transcript_6841/m.18940 type:complete len:220 (+) Transcript_6841:60-719(+)
MTVVSLWTCVCVLLSLTILSLVGCGNGGNGGTCVVKRDCPNDTETDTFDGVGGDSKCCSSWESYAKECSTDFTVVKPYACAIWDDCSGTASLKDNLTLIDWEFDCSGVVYCPNPFICGAPAIITIPGVPASTTCCSSYTALKTASCDGKSDKALACQALQDCAKYPFGQQAVVPLAIQYQCSSSAGEETMNVVAEDPIQNAVVTTSQADNTDVALLKVV